MAPRLSRGTGARAALGHCKSAEGKPFSSGTFRCVVRRLAWGAAPGVLLALFKTLSTNGFAGVEVLSLSGVMTKAIGMGASVLGLCRFRADSV